MEPITIERWNLRTNLAVRLQSNPVADVKAALESLAGREIQVLVERSDGSSLPTAVHILYPSSKEDGVFPAALGDHAELYVKTAVATAIRVPAVPLPVPSRTFVTDPLSIPMYFGTRGTAMSTPY